MKTAIVLGGTHDHIYLIELLQTQNYFVILIDYLADPPAKKAADEHIAESALDENIVLKIAKERKAELVISLCIDQTLPVMAFVCSKLGLPCHLTHAQSLSLTNKYEMKRKLKKGRIPTTDFIIIDDDIQTTVNHNLLFPLVIKPVD